MKFVNADLLIEQAFSIDHPVDGRPELVVLVEDVREATAVDAVEVVRCKDCLYSERCQSDGEWYDCMHDHGLTEICKGTDFCSYGKRREG